jgi:hypothetical protein
MLPKQERMKNITKLKIFGLTLFIMLLASCSFTQSKASAESAVAKFHEQFNAGQYHEIYTQGDEEFRKTTSEQDVVNLLEVVRRKLGTTKTSSQQGWYVNATTMGTMVTLTYETEFTEGKGIEQFVFRVSGDRAALYNYHINSNELIMK